MEGPALPRGLLTSVEGAPLPRGSAPRSNFTSEDNVPKRRRDSDKDDVLFGKHAAKPKKRAGSAVSTAEGKKAKTEQARSEKDQAERRTPSLLTYSRLTVGMRLLACVKTVTTEKAVLSLVNNITATITWSEASDEHFHAFENGQEAPSPLPEALPAGSLVRCIVTSTASDKSERTLRVSCRASLLNKGSAVDANFAVVGSSMVGTIKSIEDHGAIINFGIKSVNGFMAFSNAPGGKRALRSVGQQIEGVVSSRPSKLVANLTMTAADTLSSTDTTSFLTLQPGMLIEGRYLRRDLSDGGSLFSCWSGLFMATADWLHSGDALDLLDAKDKKSVRVLWVDPTAKTLGVSLLDHLITRATPSWTRSVGDIVEDAVITASQPRIGVKLALPELAFAQISKLVDGGKDLPSASVLKSDFPVGKKVPCRVLDMNPLDGTYSVSLQPSVLAAAVTSYDSLTPGMKVSGKVIKVDPAFGILLELGQNIRGIVTFMHLSDSSSSESAPETKFKVGQICKGRVLTSGNGKVSITLKKTLVSSPLPLITSYEEATVGKISNGFVTKVDDFGVIVTFFAGVHGIVPAHTLVGPHASKVSDLYRVGQVVKTKVVQVDPQQSRMRLTFNTTQQVEVSTGDDAVLMANLVGEVIPSVTVTNKTEAGINVEFKSPREGSQVLVKGFIPRCHLSDFLFAVPTLMESLTVGSKLKNALVIRASASTQKQKESGTCMLTLKSELLRANKDTAAPDSLDQVEIEGTYTGYVTNITDFGIFIWFGKRFGLTAFAPLANIWDTFVAKPQDFFVLNQTVRLSITSVDPEQKRIVGSLKPSVVGMTNGLFLQQFLEEQRRVFSPSTLGARLAKMKPGKEVLGRVDQRVEGAGVTVKILSSASVAEEDETEKSDELTGFCTLEHCPNQKLPRVGTEMTFRVLDVDLSSKGIVDLSARKSLEQAKWRGPDSGFTSPEFEVEVELGKKEYCIVSYKKNSKEDSSTRELALCSMVNFNNCTNPPPTLKCGVKCKAKVSRASKAILELVSSNISSIGNEAGVKARPRARSGSLSEFLGPRIDLEVGAVINAKIRDIRGCWMRLEVRQNSNKRIRVMIHSTDVIDHPPNAKYALMKDIPPGVFGGQSVGDVVQARVVEQSGSNVYLSMRPSMIEAKNSIPDVASWSATPPELGKVYQAYVDQVAPDGVWVGLSRHVRGFCFCTDVTQNLEALDELFNSGKLEEVFPVGRPIKVQVIEVDVSAQKLTVKMLWDDEGR